jgi:hypothetical protein
MPEMYGVVWQDVRAARLRKFRHVIYCRLPRSGRGVGGAAWGTGCIRLAIAGMNAYAQGRSRVDNAVPVYPDFAHSAARLREFARTRR